MTPSALVVRLLLAVIVAFVAIIIVGALAVIIAPQGLQALLGV